MLSDAEIETLAKEILTQIVTQIESWDSTYFHEVQETESGELVPVFAGTSEEGFGSYICKFMPFASIKTIIRECERIFDRFTITIKDKQTGITATTLISEKHLPESRSFTVRKMAEGATLHLISTFYLRMQEMIIENIKDSELMAQSMLAGVIARRLTGRIAEEVTADARSDIEEAAERVANFKRTLLRSHIKGMPHILAERGRGAPSKTDAERERESKAYAERVEAVYRKLRLEAGTKPTKTKVAKELGEGGINPQTGSDTSLSAFGNKLRRLQVDYDAIVKKVEDELNNNS
jgi:hypothetical protein